MIIYIECSFQMPRNGRQSFVTEERHLIQIDELIQIFYVSFSRLVVEFSKILKNGGITEVGGEISIYRVDNVKRFSVYINNEQNGNGGENNYGEDNDEDSQEVIHVVLVEVDVIERKMATPFGVIFSTLRIKIGNPYSLNNFIKEKNKINKGPNGK